MNRAFLELSGYSNEEVIGQPAWDILKPFDTKVVRRRGGGSMCVYNGVMFCSNCFQDNGPKVAVKKGQGWDGVCMGRRKSGSVLKQHLKLIPVRGSAE